MIYALFDICGQQDDGTRKLSLSAAPAQIAEDYLITVYDADEFAKAFTLTVGDTTLTYNGYAYLYTVLTNAGITDTKLKDLAKGVYRYAAAAEATFA